jgi:DNA invertase Pin-like site-specific DNA recombinase
VKTALYARVSTDEEAEDNNIESQVAALRNHARAKDYEVILEFQDDGVSGPPT